MKLWICRDEETAFCKLFTSKPNMRYSAYYEKHIWTNGMPNDGLQLEIYAYPEVTFENSPMEVELVLKKPDVLKNSDMTYGTNEYEYIHSFHW